FVVQRDDLVGGIFGRRIHIPADLGARGGPLSVIEQLRRNRSDPLLELSHAADVELAKQYRAVPEQKVLHQPNITPGPRDEVEPFYVRLDDQPELAIRVEEGL